jgi:hypothetical protein
MLLFLRLGSYEYLYRLYCAQLRATARNLSQDRARRPIVAATMYHVRLDVGN